jgi:Leucine rich repeat variant
VSLKQCLDVLVANRQNSFSFSEDILLEIAQHLNTPVSVLEAFASNQPSELYEEFRDVLFWFLRKAVAKNPNTPSSVLEKLASDGNGDVSSAAKFALKARF